LKIILARNAGFCWGVERAVDMALEATEKYGSLCILGDLIHNREVVQKLQERGARTVETPDEAGGEAVMVRAHGIPQSTRRELEERGFEIVDGTCPFVERVQKAAERFEKEGRQVLLVGKAGHPEIAGVLGHTRSGIVVRSEQDIDALPMFEKVGVVAQTTESREVFQRLCSYISARFPDVVIRDTICSATEERQSSARELAEKADVMIVVGDRHSSNTTHLAEICSALTETHHIASPDELKADWVSGRETVGVTAGASTPDWVIEQVLGKLRTLALDSGAERVTVLG
jgi:4-hydroxy-3-methylbut-2-enyl diphosphate reductase